MPMTPEALAAFDRVIPIIENPGRFTHAERATAARELRSLKAAMQADFDGMQQQIEAGCNAVFEILANWSQGDLSTAVNMADKWRTDTMTLYPDFDFVDLEINEKELSR